MSGIVELGHTGLWVSDLAVMRRFYEHVIGLTVTDEDKEWGIVFLSSRPDVEHHELVLQRGRTAPEGAKLTHQISWRLDDLEALVAYHQRFVAEGVSIQQVVTHGNALGIYFFDPEGNRNEVYWRTDVATPQPFRKTIDLDGTREQILATAERLRHDGGPAYQPIH
jgi:catechol-2,3-dioxygenase